MSTILTITGREVALYTRAGACGELIDAPAAPLGVVPCDRPGELVGCDPGCARRVVARCRCDAHGGREVAERHVLAEWAVLAPDCVGDDIDVQQAGCWGLTSDCACLVLRQEENQRLTTWLGIGSHVTRAGRGSHASIESALESGTAAWRQHVHRRVRDITEARGGTLLWGLRVEPRAEPIVITASPGQSAYAALRVQRICAALPGAHTATAPAPEWAWATEIRAPGHAPIYVWGSNIVYLGAPRGRNVSDRSTEAIVAAAEEVAS